MKKFRLRKAQIAAFAARTGGSLLRSRLLQIWVGLCILGIWVGAQARPDPGAIPFEDLFENLRVRSYRETPSDSTARFVVELAARGRTFREYDVDARRFTMPARGHRYWQSISGTRYAPLKVRGHVNRGFWLELPDSSERALLPEQFDELYSTSLDFVKPVSIATTVLGLVSGYSVGYRLGTYGSSLSNSDVQRRLVATPGLGRRIAREAWRRVAIEPVVVFEEKDPGRIATVSGRQRLYTNFFRLAAKDSNGFIPFEAAHLESIGCARESRAMLAFARAVTRASQDTCDLGSEDFAAVEEWASLLERRGHWIPGANLPRGPERLRYLGTLAWYGLAPETSEPRRIWVGPRLLVRDGDLEGFVADEIPLMEAARPVSWRDWLGGDDTSLSANAWTAQWMGEAKQFAPIVRLCMSVGQGIAGKQAERRDSLPRGAVRELKATAPQFLNGMAGSGGASLHGTTVDLSRIARRDSMQPYSDVGEASAGQTADSAARPITEAADTLLLAPDRPTAVSRVAPRIPTVGEE